MQTIQSCFVSNLNVSFCGNKAMIVKNVTAFKIHVSFRVSNFSIHSLLEMNVEKTSSTGSLNYTGPEALLYSKDFTRYFPLSIFDRNAFS